MSKTYGKKHDEILLFGKIFPEMRREIRRHADICATPCGEKKCLLRKTAHSLAENKRHFCGIIVNVNKQMQN